MEVLRQKLRVDFSVASGRGPLMSEAEELVDHLLAYVGGLLEDASVVAITRGPTGVEGRLGELGQKVEIVRSLLRAAQLVAHGGPD